MTVGGGINNIQQAYKLFRNGADKISINSHLYKDLNFILKYLVNLAHSL